MNNNRRTENTESLDNFIVPQETISFKVKLDSQKRKEENLDKIMRILLDGVENTEIDLFN